MCLKIILGEAERTGEVRMQWTDGTPTAVQLVAMQCVISENNKETAEWGVDLGSVVSISHIDIYYRTDNQQSIRYIMIYRFSNHFFFRTTCSNNSINT